MLTKEDKFARQPDEVEDFVARVNYVFKKRNHVESKRFV